MMKLTSTKSKELQFIRALVHGDSGVGKTTSLRTLPVKGTTIAVGERGALPLRQYDYKVLQLDEWGDVQDMYAAFANQDAIEDEALSTVVKATRVLAIDSLSEISDMCCDHILKVSRPGMMEQRKPAKKGEQQRKAPEGVYDDLMTMEDWGLYRTRIKSLVSAFCHLPVHIIFTSLSAWHTDKGGGSTIKTPNLSGKAALEICAYFDEVLYMRSETGQDGTNCRVWQTFDDGMVRAKDSSGVLSPIETTDWTALFKKILHGGNDGKSA